MSEIHLSLRSYGSLKTLLRISVSLLLLYLVYTSTDFPSLINTLGRMSLGSAVLLALLYTIGQAASAVKWSIFLRRAVSDLKFTDTLRAYFFGMFVNTFGLGTVGGDVVRAFMIKPGTGNRAAALASVVADRIHGLAILLCIAGIAFVFFNIPVLGISIEYLALAAFLILFVSWWFLPQLMLDSFPEGHRFRNLVVQISRAFPHEARAVLAASLISIMFHLLQIFIHLFIARELGIQVSLAYFFVIVPLVNIASSLPISVMNGVGLREALFVLFLTPMGVSREEAVAFAAVWLLIVTLVSGVSGAVCTPRFNSLKHSKENEAFGLSPANESTN